MQLFIHQKKININEYYWDDACTIQKYHFEEKLEMPTVTRKGHYARDKKYTFYDRTFQVTEDNDDFESMAQKIIDSKQGVFITGNPGCGKSHLCKMIQKKIDNFVSVTPTNKSALLIDGITIHSYIAGIRKYY